MMHTGKRKRATVYLAAAVILTCYLAQTIDCYQLRKTNGRKEAVGAKTIGVQEGKIVFGKMFEKGSSLESQVIDETKSSSNASVEDETAYQADSPGSPKGTKHDASSRETSWKRMGSSLQCGGDQMKFRAVGPGASQFAVEQANAYPMPLSHVPSTCGYSMERNSLALVLLVPYDGCNIVQEGGSYVLPMRWQGIPVSLWCPKPAVHAPTTAAPKTPKYPSHPQVPQSSYFLPYMPYPLSYPTVSTTTTKKPEWPKFPSFYPPFYHFPPFHPVKTTAPTTTTKKPEWPKFPSFYPPFYHFPPFHPVKTTAPTTTTATTTKVPHPLYQFPYVPIFPPFHPPYFPFPKHTTPKPVTTTTTQKTDHQLPLHHHPHDHYPEWSYQYPVTPTTTTTTQKTDHQLPLHQHPHDHYPEWSYQYPVTPTTTTTTQKTDHQLLLHHHPHDHYPFMPYHYPV